MVWKYRKVELKRMKMREIYIELIALIAFGLGFYYLHLLFDEAVPLKLKKKLISVEEDEEDEEDEEQVEEDESVEI